MPSDSVHAQPDEAWLHAGNLSLRYLSWGAPTNPAVVLVHGRTGLVETWTEVAQALSDRYHVLALEQRGHGRSSWSPTHAYHLTDFVQDLEIFVDQVVVDPFLLMGHSMGACTSLVYAASHPDRTRAVVLEDGGPLGTAVIDSLLGARAGLPGWFATWGEARQHMLSDKPWLHDAQLDGYMAATFVENAQGRVVWRSDINGLLSADDILRDELFMVGQWDAVRKLRRPALLLWASTPPSLMELEVAKRMERWNPHIRRVAVDCGHDIHEQRFRDFMAAVEPFLALAT